MEKLGISFNPNRYAIGLTPQVQLNSSQRVYFGNNSYSDSFQNNSVEQFFDETFIRKMIAQNKDLQKILDNFGIYPNNLNMKELEDLRDNHCRNTRDLCVEIAKNLPKALKDKVNIKDLKDAAMLHDFGKVLIPKEILNKPGVLHLYEHKIIDLHTIIGYELLKNSGINDEVLKLVRSHHNISCSYGDINLQILNLADKYSALTEQRPYKSAMTPKQALTILRNDAKNEKIEPAIFNTLVKVVANQEKHNKINVS